MSLESMRQDIQFLSGQLPHRGSFTEQERAAAEYIEGRLKETAPLTQLEEFYAPESVPGLYALYHLEFLIVAALASIWPVVAGAYGVIVFLAYMAEITGYSVFGRFLPQFETQNVVARIPAASPRRTVVVTAHYDTPRESLLGPLNASGRLRWVQAGICLSMLLVIATCGYAALGAGVQGGVNIALWVRWVATAFLLGSAWAFYTSVRFGEFTSGANNNASGVSVLIELASRFSRYPARSSELMFVATGAKETGLHGMRQLVQGMNWMKEATFFVNVTGVGCGSLAYTRGEGLLYVFPSDRDLLGAAAREGVELGIDPIVYTGAPTDAMIPMTRGFGAMSVMGVGPGMAPAHAYTDDDCIGALDEDTLQRAADFLERTIRALGMEAVAVEDEDIARAEAGD